MPFATLRLLPPSERAKGAEFLSLCDRITILERQLGPEEVKFSPEVRTLLAVLAPLPREVLHRLRLLVGPDTVPAVATQPDETAAGTHLPSQAALTTARQPLDPGSGPVPVPREQRLGLPPHPRGAGRARGQGRSLHRPGNPQCRRPSARPSCGPCGHQVVSPPLTTFRHRDHPDSTRSVAGSGGVATRMSAAWVTLSASTARAIATRAASAVVSGGTTSRTK